MVLQNLCFVAGKIIPLCSKGTLLTSVIHRVRNSKSSLLRMDKILWFFFRNQMKLMLASLLFEGASISTSSMMQLEWNVKDERDPRTVWKGRNKWHTNSLFFTSSCVRKSSVKSAKIIHWEWLCLQGSQSVARFNHNFRMGVPIDPEHYQIYADLYNIN